MEERTGAQEQAKNPHVKSQDFSQELFLDINLYQCGWEQCRMRHTFGPAVRKHFLFHYVISGKGQLTIGDQTWEIGADQGFLLFPQQLSTYSADSKDPWEYAWLEFDGMRALEIVTQAGFGKQVPVYVPVSPEAGRQALSEEMYIVDHSSDTYLCMTGHAMLFLDHLIQSSARRAPARTQIFRDMYLNEAISYIEAHYRQDLTIEELASVCGLSRNYFSRIFKEGTGESPQQFLRHYRMTQASWMLKESRLPIRDVGQRVGYENQLHFSRAFKEVFGVSPREYRQRYLSASRREGPYLPQIEAPEPNAALNPPDPARAEEN